ncbi:MAG: ferritin family protein [Sedimentisphaerales bacterium]|nr:ferritin family protein [Sedimentisphaerales bacterium]
MKDFESVDQVLDFAIAREIEAHDLYVQWAGYVKKTRIRNILNDLAQEELDHKAKLEDVKAGRMKIGLEEVRSLDIVDKVENAAAHPKMNYTELLILAMKKEDKSVKLYTKLAAASTQPKLKDIFLKLAQEETQHKLRFEVEYDLTTF